MARIFTITLLYSENGKVRTRSPVLCGSEALLQRLSTFPPVGIWVVKLSTSPQDECFTKA
jgi:hypothetical protein